MKRIYCLILALLLLFTGCGRENIEGEAVSVSVPETPRTVAESSAAPDETLGTVTLQTENTAAGFPDTLVYTQEELARTENVHYMTMDGSTPYLWGNYDVYRYDGDLTGVLHLTFDDETGAGTSIEQLIVRDGKLYAFQETYQIVNDNTEVTQSIVCYENGEMLFACEDVGYRDENSICCIQVDDEGYIYVMHKEMIRIMTPDGAAHGEIQAADGLFMWQLYRGGDGKIYVQKLIADTNDEFVYYRIQPDGTLEAITDFEESSLFFAADGTAGYLGYYFDGDILSAVSLTDYSFTEILSVQDSQMPQWSMVAVGEDHKIYGLYVEGDLFDAQATLCCLNPVTGEGIPAEQQKPVLTIAYMTADEIYIDPLAEMYNESDGDYYLEAICYQQDGMTMEEAYAALEQDILSGNGPDLVFCNGNYRSLGQRGFLMDLYPYLDSAESFSRADLMWLSALEDDGKLYSLSSVAIEYGGFIGLERAYGDVGELTYDSLSAIMEETGLYQDSRKTCWWLLYQLLPGYLPEAVDYENAKSDFRNETFYSLLELAKLVGRADDPTENVSDEEELFESFDSWFQRHPEELYSTGGHTDTLWNLLRVDSQITEDTILFGLPGKDENLGLTVRFRTTLGISAGTEDPEGAWSVIRFMMTEMREYYSYYNSLFQSEFDAKVQEYLDPAGEYEGREIVINDDGTWYLDGELITEEGIPSTETIIPPEDIQAYADMIKDIKIDGATDWSVCSIIKETIQDYFHGNGTAEEAAERVEQAVDEYLMTLPKYK